MHQRRWGHLSAFKCILIIVSLIASIHRSISNNYEETNEIIEETASSTESAFESQSPVALYDKGVKDYLDNNYNGCIHHLERALKAYSYDLGKLRWCHIRCHEEITYNEPLYKVDIENLRYYEAAIKNTLCLLKCKKRESISDIWHYIDKNAIELFEKRKPYEYLQACYAQAKQFQQAANAAFTYLVVNPNDGALLASLKYYAQQPEVVAHEVTNREAKDYVYLYVHGMYAYEEKQWTDVIQDMEASLKSFLQEETECRAQCEAPFDQVANDFTTSIANLFTHTLICKQKCNNKLSTLNGEKHDDLLPSHYHYLQYAYFKAGKLQDACRAVASYLLFYPADKTMMHNKKYYSTLPKVEEDFFKPREEALRYIYRDAYETKIMNYVTNVFAVETAKFNHDIQDNQINTRDNVQTESPTGLFNLVRTATDTKRFVMNKFVTEEECQQLLHIAEHFTLPGDGYETGGGSPHTVYENYHGLSLKRARNLAKRKLLDIDFLSLLLNVTENVKQAVGQALGVRKYLHFAYTHLVCRSAKSGDVNRTDFSHPVHADNCNIQINGTCPKIWPAYTWRDYTAILYLNDDFHGGEFFFSGDYFGTKVERVIKPTCGRLVGFTSGGENLHGVRAIHSGKRCALAVWFTHDPIYAEDDRKMYNILLPNK